jgi:hypothetical protein
MEPSPFCRDYPAGLRLDFATQFASGWSEVRSRTDTVELFIEMLTRNEQHPQLDLAMLATNLSPKRVAFQVGTIRPSGCMAGAGRTAADLDRGFLQDWTRAGGHIHGRPPRRPLAPVLLTAGLAPPAPAGGYCNPGTPSLPSLICIDDASISALLRGR